MSDDLTLPEKIERLGEDANLLHAWTHGDEAATVVLGGVDTPSPRKMMHDLDARESAAAQAAIAAGVTAAGNSAAAAAQSAQIASAGADVVTAHAQSIELVAANIEAVQGASGNAADAAASAAAAAASAAAAAGAVPENLVARVAEVESKNSQQDTRLDGVEVSTTAINSALSGKANQAMDNLTSAGTTAIAHNSLPSASRIVALTIPADAYSVNALGDGYVKFVATASAANQYIRLWFGALDTCIWSSSAGQLLSVCVPCLKNQPVFVAGTAPTSRALQFIYAHGAY